MNELIRIVTERIKKLCSLREPPYELPADSFIDKASEDIINSIFDTWQWIDINERLPSINTLIIVYDKKLDIVALHAFYDLDNFKASETSITHWMPIPRSPK